MFLQIKQILELETEAAIRDRLGKLPPTLEAAYDEIYEKINARNKHDRALADRAFKWVMCAIQPLKSEALLAAVRLDPESDGFELSDEINEAQLLHLCNNLLLIDAQRGTWRASHLSVVEYFEQNHWTLLQAHCDVAKACLKLLLDTYGEHRNEQCGIFDPTHPLQRYTSPCWLNHIQVQEGHPPDLRLAHLLKRFLGSFEESSIPYQRWYNESKPGAWIISLRHTVSAVSQDFIVSKREVSPENTTILTVCMFAIFTLLSDWWATAKINLSQTNLFPMAVRGGSIAICEELIKRGIAKNLPPEDHKMALETATEQGNTRMVEFLLEQDPELNAPAGTGWMTSALGIAAYNGRMNIAKSLIGRGANANGLTSHDAYGSVLVAAVRSGDMQIVRFLVDEHGADINMAVESWDYGSALVVAAAFSNLEALSFLVERGANINMAVKGGNYGSALAVAAASRSIETVSFLVEQGADINMSLKSGRFGSALAAAANYGIIEIVSFLVERGADINMSLEGGNYGSALAAAASGELETVSFLVEQGADINMSLKSGNYGSALAVAASKSIETVSFLVERGADINMSLEGGNFGSALVAAAASGELEIVSFLVERGADINVTFESGRYGSVLTAAVAFGKLEIVSFLVEQGADVDMALEGGDYGSVLAAGAYHGRVSVVKFLLDRGADPNMSLPNAQFGSALDAAVSVAHETSIMRFGGKPVYDNYAAARMSREKEMVELLIDRGADVNLRFSKKGVCGSALGTARSMQKPYLADLLLRRGANELDETE